MKSENKYIDFVSFVAKQGSTKRSYFKPCFDFRFIDVILCVVFYLYNHPPVLNSNLLFLFLLIYHPYYHGLTPLLI